MVELPEPWEIGPATEGSAVAYLSITLLQKDPPRTPDLALQSPRGRET